MTRPRSSGIFSGVALILFGVAFLLHNYRGFEFEAVLVHWWPVLLIVLGLIKLYERTSGRYSPGAARITAGEIFLVLGLLLLVGIVVGVDTVKGKFPGTHLEFGDFGRNSYDYDLEVAPKPVAPNARIVVRSTRGDITVRSSDEAEIRVSGKKNVRAWSDNEAAQLADRVSVEVVKNGDGYEIRPSGSNTGDSRLSFNVEIVVPKKSQVTVRNEKGDIIVSDIAGPVIIDNHNGDVDIRNTTGDVSIDMRHGDAKVADTKGDIKLAGKGGEVDVTSASGGLTVDGEFYGPIRADKIARGVRYISQRSDLTLSQLSGHLELGSGNLEITDAPGNLQLRTNRYDVDVENVGGKAKIENRDGTIEVRSSSPPKDDIDITNANAIISLSLPATSSFEISADCHSCDIDSDFSGGTLSKTSSGSGDNHLQGKYGTGRATKIALKTSYGNISLRKTSGDSMQPPSPPRVPRPPRAGAAPEIPEPEEN
ncbi:MAG TPA: DUF4097 family beta strand repeat-containing protein [Candidatus Acidoferrales bacterium]|jgi:Domain of unknown function (DUF5668)|nr:DUF4097 family beta strand repeat-containing protein [Candidatus Acidoferrales bacterium]